MNQRDLLIIELCVFLSWFALLFFALLIYLLDLGSLSSFGLGSAVALNIPISICYGLFAARFKPPVASYFMQRFQARAARSSFSKETSPS